MELERGAYQVENIRESNGTIGNTYEWDVVEMSMGSEVSKVITFTLAWDGLKGLFGHRRILSAEISETKPSSMGGQQKVIH